VMQERPFFASIFVNVGGDRKLSRPLAVQIPVVDGLGQVLHPDVRHGVQVRDGAGQPQNARVRPCRQPQALVGHLQEAVAVLPDGAIHVKRLA